MGKRSSYPRRPMDDYATTFEAVVPLIPHIHGIHRFAEPCCGDGDLIRHLEMFGLECVYSGDLKTGEDALCTRRELFNGPDAIITNPPWTRWLLHPLIWHFQRIAPTWLLFDADWMHCRQAVPFLDHCSTIVSVGRVKWITGSKNTGMDNASWYCFDARHQGGPHFIGRDGVKKPLLEIPPKQARAA